MPRQGLRLRSSRAGKESVRHYLLHLRVVRCAIIRSRFLYVILDIRDRGPDDRETAGLAERRGKDAPFQCRSAARGRLSAAQVAERRKSWSAAVQTNAIDWLTMS